MIQKCKILTDKLVNTIELWYIIISNPKFYRGPLILSKYEFSVMIPKTAAFHWELKV